MAGKENHQNVVQLELSTKFDALVTEHQICRQKLESKCEALLILSRELAECRSERDQFQLMAEQLRERYQVLKRQLAGHRPMSPSHDDSSSSVDLKQYATSQGQGLAQVLMEYREQNKCLEVEVEDLKQKLHDAQGDIKLLREQIVRSRVGTIDEGMTTRHFPAYEREDLVKQLEESREQTLQLERDLQQVLDEKQELVTERDAYRHKHGRLNMELNYILKGDEKGVVDIDAVIMENKYLQERLKQMEEEKSMAMETVSKYKSILEKKKNKGILKVGQNRSGGLIITQKQVQQMIQDHKSISPTPQAMADLQALCLALLDSVNDKTMALSHQRKANKILGNRVSELEKKLKTLEVAGLWSVSEHMSNLEKLKMECNEVKALVPCPPSEGSENSDHRRDSLSDLDSNSAPQTPSSHLSPSHGPLGALTDVEVAELVGTAGGGGREKDVGEDGGAVRDMESDLDLLPTKEEVVKHVGDEEEMKTGRILELCSATDLNLDRLNLSADDGDHQDLGSLEVSDIEEEDDVPGSEKSRLLADNEDNETARQLQTFMETVTAKILDQQHHHHRGPAPPQTEHCISPSAEEGDIRVMGGGSGVTGETTSLVCSGDLVTSQSVKQPLLQEMSEPAQDREVDEKSVEC